ncbi:MAG: HNH endonuclease [Acidobacteria bacterium]|nr:HNH endonuclease [Acidobacteriota bacterium]
MLKYRYRGNDVNHRDNVGLRETCRRGLPLIYFHGTIPGAYVAQWPVFVVVDTPQELTFGVTFDERSQLQLEDIRSADNPHDIFRRRYKTAEVRIRLHQRVFRDRVLRAYKSSCALCRLRHSNLLDAAHIIPDTEDQGEPIVSNGLALCKLHHAAFDANILGITPDLVAEIRDDILEEIDGPMLQHGLKEMHRTRIITPFRSSEKPNRALLEVRYERFRAA